MKGREKMLPRGVVGRDGVTLVELLVVVVIIGILATVAIPRLQNPRERAHFATVQQDLRNVGTAQELHYRDYGEYAQNPEDLVFEGGERVEVDVQEATLSGWAATAIHESLADDRGCAIYFGNVDPPDLPDGSPHDGGEGTVQCTE